MTDYTKTTDFTAKDNLITGDPLKVIKGSYFDTEFDNIATAITSKYDSTDLATQSQAEAGTGVLTLMTPLRSEQHVTNWAKENDGMVFDIHELDLAADALLGWDQSGTAAIGFTLGAGLSFSTTTLNLASAVAGTGLTMTSQVLNVIGGDGITANANDIALTARSKSTTIAIVVASGLIDLDFSSLTNRTIADTVAADSIVFNNGGVMEQIDFNKMGLRVVEEATVETFALVEANTLQLLTGSDDKAWTIPTNASVAFHIGAIIYLGARDTGEVTVTVGGSVTLTSRFGTGTSTTDTVQAGGLAALIKVATDEWMLTGDIRD